MNIKIKKIFTNLRVIILLVFLILAIISINPNIDVQGVAIRNVLTNSSGSIAGIESPKPNAPPRSREIITAVNNKVISNIEDFYEITSDLSINSTIPIKTNKKNYILKTKPLIETIVLSETETKEIIEEVYDNETNSTKNVTSYIEVNKTQTNVLGTEDIGLKVYNAPTTNVRKGLDLQGGTRVLLQPQEVISEDELDLLLENMKYRLNVYGLTDVVVREAGDLSGNQYILVEMAGANEEEVRELLAKQGKFEAKIGNNSVFRGGDDITYVCRSADCSGIDPMTGCGMSGDQWFCRFRFSISLSPEAAERQAEITKDLDVITEENDEYLTEKLILFLDDANVDELNIGADLRGRAVTDISISGSGVGATEQEAAFNSLKNMKRLQTIMITGSLPVQIDIVKMDSISPVLGEEFVNSAIIIGLFALLAVGLVVFIRYRKIEIVVPMILNVLIEVILLLGVASIIGWNLDLAAIAGIVIAVGTGVDHLIVLTDETIRGEISQIFDWKKRIKSAFFIIMAAYFTTVVAMFPLLFAGAGLLKGFALTTIIGVSIGVFISRPAYANIVEILLKE